MRSHLDAYVIPSDPHTGLRCLFEHFILQSESLNALNSTWKYKKKYAVKKTDEMLLLNLVYRLRLLLVPSLITETLALYGTSDV